MLRPVVNLRWSSVVDKVDADLEYIIIIFSCMFHCLYFQTDSHYHYYHYYYDYYYYYYDYDYYYYYYLVIFHPVSTHTHTHLLS